jgi:uncharacterized Tic20 family protein
MSEEGTLTQEEKTLAGLAHGSILLGLVTNGIGGVLAALVIWVVKKEKSPYLAFQALQAMVYQSIVFVVTMVAWCCWGLLWTALILVPLSTNPAAYDVAPPAGMWVGLLLIVIPLGLWGLTILYGLWGAARSLSGHDFQYAIIGRWLKEQSIA